MATIWARCLPGSMRLMTRPSLHRALGSPSSSNRSVLASIAGLSARGPWQSSTTGVAFSGNRECARRGKLSKRCRTAHRPRAKDEDSASTLDSAWAPSVPEVSTPSLCMPHCGLAGVLLGKASGLLELRQP